MSSRSYSDAQAAAIAAAVLDRGMSAPAVHSAVSSPTHRPNGASRDLSASTSPLGSLDREESPCDARTPPGRAQ
jgi:hypothetical protein